MTAFTSRATLRTAVLAAVAAGAVLVPSNAAFAEPSPKPSAPAEIVPSPERSRAAAEAPRETRPSLTPRGGVAAGERPTGSSDNSTTAPAGTAAGVALLAGASILVLRRRSADSRNS